MSGAFDIAEPIPQQPPVQEESTEEFTQRVEGELADNEAKLTTFINTVRKLGRDSGNGKEALPNLIVATVDAIYDGALNPKNKFRGDDGKQIDAAHYILEVYGREEGRKLSHERTALGKKTQASKINQVIKASRNSDHNFRGAIDRAIEVRNVLLGSEDKKRVKPAFDTYVSMARTQLKNKAVLSDEDIRIAALRSAAGSENNFVKELKRMHTRLNKLLTDGAGEVRISTEEPIFDSMEQVSYALQEAIRVYEPNYQKSEPEAAQAAQ